MRKGHLLSITFATILLATLAYAFRPRGRHDAAFADISRGLEYPTDDHRVTLSAPGITEPRSRNIDIASEVTGILRLLHVKAGDPVSKGQVLAELDHDIQAAEVELAEAALQRAQAALARLRNGDRPEERAVLKAHLKKPRHPTGWRASNGSKSRT